MGAIIVKCPACEQKVRLRQKPAFFFRHCGIAHPIAPNLITEGFKNSAKNGSSVGVDDDKNVEIEVEKP